VYAAFTGAPSRQAVLWAAVLRAGPGAVLSFHSAAELYQLGPAGDAAIHVTVPLERRICRVPGLVVHRSGRLDQARHPVLQPPRTRIEDTTLDLVQVAATFDDAFAWLCKAVGRRLTTAALLRAAMDARQRVRWRADLAIALSDIGSGARSNLEYRYIRAVERGRGLPPARRQVKMVIGPRTCYLDNLYQEVGVAVELDGQAAHPVEDRWSDVHRDNGHASVGMVTLRYSWPDVTLRPCLVAQQVSAVLRARGTAVSLRRCGPGCAIGRRHRAAPSGGAIGRRHRAAPSGGAIGRRPTGRSKMGAILSKDDSRLLA
jgi:hypothetical protein